MNDPNPAPFLVRRFSTMCLPIAFLLFSWCFGACNEATETRPAGNLKPAPRPLDTARIWHELFPADHHFDEQGRLTRTIVRRGKAVDMVTSVARTIPYREGFISKALVVLHSYDVSGGNTSDCKACAPETDVAVLQWETGEWRKVLFEQNWDAAHAEPGMEATVEIDSSVDTKFLMVKRFKIPERDLLEMRGYSLKTLKPLPGVNESRLE